MAPETGKFWGAIGRTLSVVAVVHSNETGGALNETCAEMDDMRVRFHMGEPDDVRPGVEIFDAMDILILELDPAHSEDFQALESITNERFPNVPVVVIESGGNLRDVRRLMRLGAVDVLPQPIRRSDIADALELAESAITTCRITTYRIIEVDKSSRDDLIEDDDDPGAGDVTYDVEFDESDDLGGRRDVEKIPVQVD